MDGTRALFVREPSQDTYSAYWTEHAMSAELREARMESQGLSAEDVKHAALWRENYILLFVFLQVLFNKHR